MRILFYFGNEGNWRTYFIIGANCLRGFKDKDGEYDFNKGIVRYVFEQNLRNCVCNQGYETENFLSLSNQRMPCF